MSRDLSIQHRKSPSRKTVFVCLAMLAWANQIQAEEESKQAVSAEKITVTGSRIGKAAAETTNPVISFDRETIEKSGAATVDEFIEKQTISPIGGFDESSNDIGLGSGSADLFGIGARRTLVLLNGNRLPSSTYLQSVNLRNIPIAAIKRIEILTGSASAVYGADAVAGVVNVITEDDYEGVQVDLYQSTPQDGGGNKTSIDLSHGAQFGNVNVLTGLGYSTRSEIYSKNRDITTASNPDYNWAWFYAPESTYSYRVIDIDGGEGGKPLVGNFKASANCPAGNIRTNVVPQFPTREYCAGNSVKEGSGTLTPKGDDYYVFNKINWELSSDVTISNFAYFTKAQSSSNRTPLYEFINDVDVTLVQQLKVGDVRDVVPGLEQYADDDLIDIRTPSQYDLPRGRSYNISQSVGDVLEAKGTMGEVWDWNVSSSYFRSTFDRYSDKSPDKQVLYDLLHGANASYRPFDPNRNRALLADATKDLKASDLNTRASLQATLSRDLFELPGGAFAGLIGVAGTQEAYKQSGDEKDRQFVKVGDEISTTPRFTGSFTEEGEGKRSIASLFAEVSAPILKEVSVDAAGRLDDYSDFGSTFNYSLGTKYTPVEQVMLRANYGTSFKAPDLAMIHAKGGGGYSPATDQPYCDSLKQRNIPCENSRLILVQDSGNPDIKEETATSMTFGLLYEPIKRLFFAADYYRIAIDGVHSQDSLQSIVDTWNTTKTNIGANEVLADENGFVQGVKRPYRNLAELELQAVNVKAGYNTKFSDVDFGLLSNYFQYLAYKRKLTADSPTKDLVGIKNYSDSIGGIRNNLAVPTWKLNNEVSVGLSDHNVTLSSQTTSKMKHDPDNLALQKEKEKFFGIDQYTSYDVYYRYAYSTKGSISLGVINVLNELGGLDASGSITGAESTNSELYNYTGRSFFAKVSQSF